MALVIVPCLLTACVGSTASVKPEGPPPSLVQECRAPVALPARDASQAEVERWWRADRAALAECREKHGGLAGWAARVAAR